MASKTRQVSADKPLTPKQAAFVAEYVKDGNATQAAIRAGYSASTARSIASENLTKPAIIEAIRKAQALPIQRVERSLGEAAGSAAWVVDRAVEAVNRAMTPVPVYYKGEPTTEMQWAGGVAVSALTLLAKQHAQFKDASTAPVDARSLTIIGTLDEATLRALAGGIISQTNPLEVSSGGIANATGGR